MNDPIVEEVRRIRAEIADTTAASAITVTASLRATLNGMIGAPIHEQMATETPTWRRWAWLVSASFASCAVTAAATSIRRSRRVR